MKKLSAAHAKILQHAQRQRHLIDSDDYNLYGFSDIEIL